MMAEAGRSPSLEDELRPEQVAAFKRTAINTIIETGSRLSIDQLAMYTAVVFLHRFYAVKSLVRNDPFIMSVACLYLGGKVEDSPKSVRDVLVASCEFRFGAEAARRLTHDKATYENLKDKIFVAERALLYALNFQFAVDHAYQPLINILKNEPLLSFREQLAKRDAHKQQQLSQLPFNLVNDCIKTEACLRYSGRQIAAACLWLAMKLLKEDTHIYTDKGQLWWVAQGVTEDDLEGVEDHLQDLYTSNLYATYSSVDLVLQSAQTLDPEKARAAQQQAAAEEAAAAAAPPPQQHAAAAAALPADIAAANRECWAAVQGPAGAAAVVAPLPPQAEQPAAAAVPAVAAAAQQPEQQQEQQQDDYDDLLKELSP